MVGHLVAGALLLFGVAVAGSAAVAAPPNDPASPAYDSESPARIRQEMDRPRAADVPSPAQGETAGYPNRGNDTPARECADCPAPKHYDSVEVVKTSRDVDQSRVINTDRVIQLPPKVKESNKLVIHENETRNVGVIQHNDRVIEKQIHYVKRAPVYHRAVHHRVIKQVKTVYVPVVVQAPRPCGCPCSCQGSSYAHQYGHGGYAYVVQEVLVPVQTPAAYGYAYAYR
jgi:hypothetical protein